MKYPGCLKTTIVKVVIVVVEFRQCIFFTLKLIVKHHTQNLISTSSVKLILILLLPRIFISTRQLETFKFLPVSYNSFYIKLIKTDFYKTV